MEEKKCIIENGKIICTNCNTKNGIKRKYCYVCAKDLNVDEKEREEVIKTKPKTNLPFIISLIVMVSILTVISIIFKVNCVELENNNSKLKIEINEKDKSIKEKEEKILELSKEEKINEIQGEIDDLTKTKNKLSGEIDDLNGEKTTLQEKLDKLNGDIIKAKGKTKKYPAGYLTAGKDFETGRYKIFGGSSNFVVRSSRDDLRVNIILGNDTKWGEVKEYIYDFDYGDEIDASSSFKMQPVE